MKVLNVIKKIFLGIFGFVFFVFAIAMTVLLLNYNKYGVTQFGDTSLIIIKSDVTSEKYKKGDLILVDAQSLMNYKPGDEIFAYRSTEGKVSLEFGVVDKVDEKEQSVSFANGATFSSDFIAGKASKVYNGYGTVLSIIESKWGFLFMILVPCFLVFIYEIYALIIEIKYGNDEANN